MSKFHFFRTISLYELADIKATEKFNVSIYGLEAKQFVLNLEDALFFKNRFTYIEKYKASYTVIKILLDQEYYEKLTHNPNIKMWIDDKWVITIQEEDLVEFNLHVIEWQIID